MKVWTHDILNPKDWKGQAVNYVQVKENGRRLTLFQQPRKRLLGWGRDHREHLELSEYLRDTQWWKDFQRNLPPFSSVDGELIVPGKRNSDVITAIKEDPKSLRFIAFAVPMYSASSLRMSTLAYAERVCNYYVRFAEWSHFEASIDTAQYLKEEAAIRGIEGYVLKVANYQGWWKVKPTRSVDAVITRIKDGRGKYIGLIGAFVVSCDGVEIASVSGMDDDARCMLEKDVIGRVIEVEFQDVGSNGRLIHPRFIRFRDDKNPDECRLEQLT